MASFYPHKGTIVITLICALAVAGTASYAQWTKPTEKPQLVVATASTNTDAPIATDSDTWKKQFFDSGASKIPAVATNKQASADDSESLTLTDKIGREFFAHYIDLKQSNLTTDNTAVQNAVNNTLDKAVIAASQPKLYMGADIHISSNQDETSIRTYGNAVGNIFSLYAPRTSPGVITTNAFEKGDMTLLVQIDPIIASYKKTVSALLQLSVPAPLAEQHLALVNGLSAMVYISQGLRLADTDPMQSLVALGTYTTAQSVLQNSLQGMKTYFNSHSIYFSSSEPGVIFLGA